MAKKVASFDIFDTCLIRKCGRPVDFFDIFSFHAFKEEVDDNTRMAFLLSRIAADEDLDKIDKTIEDIYENLSFTHEKLYPKESLIQKEQAFEREMLIPSIVTQKKISELREKGFTILFISDMYLHTDFLKSVLSQYGFFNKGDSIYISCDVGLTKSSGELFEHIAQKEKISYYDWEHYGDNPISDISVPSKMGINCQKIEHESSPFQQKWLLDEFSTKFRYNNLMANIGRAIRYSVPNTIHTLFAIDIISPILVPFVCNIFLDAKSRGITDLYFFSRDAFSAYQIAKTLSNYFDGIHPHYLYTSQEAMYSGDERLKLEYYEQEGLASSTQKNAIVDIRSTGKSLEYLNKFLLPYKKYNPIFGYYLDIFCDSKKTHNRSDYYSEFNGAYDQYSPNGKLHNAFTHWSIFEMFLSPHTTPKTTGYIPCQGKILPVFPESKTTMDCIIDNSKEVTEHHNLVLQLFTEYFIQLQLFRYSHEIFRGISIPTICHFFKYPPKEYLESLTCFRIWNQEKQCFSPYIEKKNLLYFFFKANRKKLIWPIGSLIYSLPSFLPPRLTVTLFNRIFV